MYWLRVLTPVASKIVLAMSVDICSRVNRSRRKF